MKQKSYSRELSSSSEKNVENFLSEELKNLKPGYALTAYYFFEEIMCYDNFYTIIATFSNNIPIPRKYIMKTFSCSSIKDIPFSIDELVRVEDNSLICYYFFKKVSAHKSYYKVVVTFGCY